MAKRLYTAATPVEAQFVKAFLASAGIEVTVRGEHLFALRGFVPMTEETLPTLWVEDDDDLERALQLLAQLEARSRLRTVDAEDEDDDAAEDWESDEAGEGVG